jgi:hypoxia-inducible factor (prolyl hydroxylase)
MLANYPGGGSRFARHIDNTTGDGRRLTLLIYLNPNWTPELGGALRLTPPGGDPVDVYPMGGRLAMFYSADCPHEVRPAYGDRHAITLWYYDQEERYAAMMMAKEAGRSAGVAKSSTQAQVEAKSFIGQLMGGDEVGADGGSPTEKELSFLVGRVRAMNDEALNIVASITGAKSVTVFREGFEMLSVLDLKGMRQLFRRMGME